MSAHDRARWDAIYRARHDEPYPPPDPLLLEYTPPVVSSEKVRRALDLAAGMGQNGLWLASQGYTVDVMEISRVALSRARVEMASRNLRKINLLQVDLDDFEADREHYHVVCVFRYLKRDIMPALCAAVAPGGRIIYETFNLNYLDLVPDFNTAFLLEPGELAQYFEDWQILRDEEQGHISQLVAVKPGDEW